MAERTALKISVASVVRAGTAPCNSGIEPSLASQISGISPRRHGEAPNLSKHHTPHHQSPYSTHPPHPENIATPVDGVRFSIQPRRR